MEKGRCPWQNVSHAYFCALREKDYLSAHVKKLSQGCNTCSTHTTSTANGMTDLPPTTSTMKCKTLMHSDIFCKLKLWNHDHIVLYNYHDMSCIRDQCMYILHCCCELTTIDIVQVLQWIMQVTWYCTPAACLENKLLWWPDAQWY